MANKYDYDVIIIGAGISGLVCGCYLAKAGMKTLIVEKNAKPGGYCTSFKRNGFHFDACAHGLGSLRKGGRLNKLMDDLELVERLKIIRHNPSDTIITSDSKIKIYNSLNATINEFQKSFSQEKRQIESFFKFIVFSNTSAFVKLRSKTFEQLLDYYFEDERLKTILAILILGFVGLPPFQVSSVVACLILREFVFDGGYYPKGGIQTFPDSLATKFTEFKGDMILSNMVKKIKVKENRITGVILQKGQYISTRYIVSACDVRHTFFELIEKGNVKAAIKNKVNSMKPSSSAFLVYLGINKDLSQALELATNLWIINNYDIRKIHSNMKNHMNDCLLVTTAFIKNGLCSGKNKTSVRLESSTFYKNKKYWNEDNKDQLAERFIKIAEQIIPNLSKYIILKLIATPLTLYKWTYNYRGAAFGWESTTEQFGEPDMSQKTMIDNLYLTGHWSNQSSGIAFMVNCGYDTADLILQKEKRK